MKRFRDMTEDEILNEALRAIHEYMSRIQPHAEFKLDRAVGAQVNLLNGLFRNDRGLSYRDTLTGQDAAEWDSTKAYFEPRFAQQARVFQQRYMKAEAVWTINETMAQALIIPAFKNAGLKAKVFPQRYRAQVFVCIGDRTLRFYIPYKELGREGLMEGVINSVKEIKDALSRLGRDVKISK